MKMKLTVLLLLLLLASCVQQTRKRVIVVTLQVPKGENIQTVGLRGSEKPLSWQTDYPMAEMVKDRLYKATIMTTTGYLFTEMKCTINGNFEMQDQSNRRIVFDTHKDTTHVNLIFGQQ